MESKKKDEQTSNTEPYDLQSYVNCKSDGVNKPVNAESVAQAMEELKNQGKEPSSPNIRDVLGHGSYSTILKYKNEALLKESIDKELLSLNALDDKDCNLFAKKLVKAAIKANSDLCDAKIKQSMKLLESYRRSISAELEQLLAINERVTKENEELNKQVAELQKTCEEERGKALAALTKRDELDAKVTKLLDKMGD